MTRRGLVMTLAFAPAACLIGRASAAIPEVGKGKILASRVFTAADDFVIDVFHNGLKVPDDFCDPQEVVARASPGLQAFSCSELTYVRKDYTLGGHSNLRLFASCPSSTYVVGGGCGHRDGNGAQDDITVNYAGPYSDAPANHYACYVNNSSGDSRAIRAWAICASATSVTVP